MKPILQIKNLSLTFTLDYTNSTTLKDSFSSLFTRKDKKFNNTFKALNNISLNFVKGEKVAIIGKNGAGKSTLLKCIANIYQDYSGVIQCNGTIAPLIEIGAGFHPDLTGRENLRLNAAIFGKNRNEIDLLEDSIIQFSGIEKFIDIPVKKYSSGMFMRLAFSIATSVSPDILILDESFSAGDEEFNKLAHLRMKSTIDTSQLSIMISHDEKTLKKFCNRGIVINEGEILFDGDIYNALSFYNNRENFKKKITKHLSQYVVLKNNIYDPVDLYFTLLRIISSNRLIKFLKNYLLNRNKKNKKNNVRKLRFFSLYFILLLCKYIKLYINRNLNYMNDLDYSQKYFEAPKELMFNKNIEIFKESIINEINFNLTFNNKVSEIKVEKHNDESIKIFKFESIRVKGKSSLYVDLKNGVFFSFYKNLINHNLSEEFRTIKRLDNKLFEFTFNKKPHKLEEAISLLHSCSSNYCHMMVEIFPLINAIKYNDKYKNLPILIDSNLHKNIYEIIFSLHPDINIVFVNPRVDIHVKSLIYLSSPSFFPFDPNIANDNTLWFSLLGINNMVKNLKEKYIKSNIEMESSTKKYYLCRGSHYRNIDNESEVVQYCISRGYEIINPSELSVTSQINLFSKAKIIISPTGAVLANLIFCNRKARVGILYSDSSLLDLNLWPKLVSATSRVKINIIKCKSKNPKYMHTNYSVSQKELSKFIDLVET